MSGTDGVLQGFTSGLVDQRESRAPLFILHPSAVLLILIPMLVLIGGIGGSENDLAATNGEREIGIGFGENSHSGFARENTGVNLVAQVMNRGGGWRVVVRGVVHGAAASVSEGVMVVVMGRWWRRGSGVVAVVEDMGHVGFWLMDAVEGWWRVVEGVTRRRVNGGSFVVVVVVPAVRVVEGERHCWFCVLEI